MTAPLRSRLTSTWAMLLAGPVVGTIYFFAVYLFAEATCADGVELLSTSTLRIVILAGAAASVGVFALYAVRARWLWTRDDQQSAQGRQNERFMLTTGLILLGLFVLFVLFLAAPAVGSSLC